MKIYYTYRPKFNNNIQTDITTPAEIFRVQYPEFAWLLTFTDFNDWNLLNKVMWERFGFVEFNENYLPKIDVETELVENKDIRIYLKDSIKMIDWIKTNTNLIEETPWMFILSEETTWIDWEIVPKQYLIIN